MHYREAIFHSCVEQCTENDTLTVHFLIHVVEPPNNGQLGTSILSTVQRLSLLQR